MSALAFSLAVAAPLFLAGSDEKSFFHLPGDGDFRWQAVERAGNERDWPFTVNKGWLACVYVVGERTAYFVEDLGEDDESYPRAVVISTDAFDLSLGNLGKAEIFDRSVGLEELIRRVAPLVQAGRRLCDQPRGTTIGPGEL